MKRLECKALHYQWGRKGAESTVAQLRKDTIEEDEYYAELWMGTHARGPSQVKEGEARIPLADYFKDHPDVLGQHEKDGTGLQFLLKVLSVGKCLSLQLHPTKEQARELHAADQANYPDDNHKPELTIALTDFEILCGFQKPDAILQNLRSHEALVELIGEKGLLSFDATQGEEEKKAALKNIFTQIWTIPPEEIGTLLTKLLADIFLKEQRSQTDDLIMGLSEHFPEDIGILAPLFLNYVKLKPGEATFLGPNEPHSYLSGDCIECMAQSDNTIRAGLTPKFKNVNLFCENLTYRMGGPPIFEPRHLADGVEEYSPAVKEFAVHKLNKEASVVHPIAAASILIVVNGSATIIPNEGNGEKIEKGDVLFLPQQIEAKLSEKFDNFLAFRAHTPVPIYFIAPLMLETQPRKIIIMNQPFEDNHTLQIKIVNPSQSDVVVVYKTNMVGIKFEPNHALIRKNSKVKVSISFSGVDLSSNMRRRIALIFMNTTKDRSINELFLGDGIYGRKELMVKLNK